MLSMKSKLVALIFSVLLVLIAKYVVDHNAEALPQLQRQITYASLPIAGGLTTLSLCSLLKTFVDTDNLAASHLLREDLEAQTTYFFIGFLATAYLSLIRPPLAAYVPFLPYVEWVAVALVVYVMYDMTKPSAKELYIGSEGAGWKKHVQDVGRETGRDLIRITSVMQQFVDYGVKEPLLVYLTLHLQRLGETEESILKLLKPLITYQENARRHRLYYLAFPWRKRKLAERSKKAREDLLKKLLKNVGCDENESGESESYL